MSDIEKSKVDEFLHQIKNRRVPAIIVVFSLFIIALGQITGSLSDVAAFVSNLGQGKGTIAIEYVVINARSHPVTIEPFSRIYITSTRIGSIWIFQEPDRRLLLRNEKRSSDSTYEIVAGGRKTYAAEFSLSSGEAELLGRGNADVHFALGLENSDVVYSITLPFHESRIKDRLLLEYTIGTDSLQPTQNLFP